MVLLAQRDLTQFLSSLNLAGSPIAVRDALLEFFPELVTVYGDAAALLGADFYDAMRNVPASAATFRAVLDQPVATAQAQASARWGLGPLFDAGDTQTMTNRLTGSLQRLVLMPGRNSFANSAFRDPVRTSWARVPTGLQTCKWCVKLASRGAVYGSAESAGEMSHYHDVCDCVPVAIRSEADWPEGHDVAEFQALYRQDSGVGRDILAE